MSELAETLFFFQISLKNVCAAEVGAFFQPLVALILLGGFISKLVLLFLNSQPLHKDIPLLILHLESNDFFTITFCLQHISL